jgi:NADPH-dependent curcumin reductase CurA
LFFFHSSSFFYTGTVCIFLTSFFENTAYQLDSESNPAHGSVGIGKPIPALGYGKVVKGNDTFKEGTVVQGMLKAEKFAVIEDPSRAGIMTKMSLPRTDPNSSLGVLGISGIAAYIGMFACPPKGPQKGETVVVSAAAGAVGCIAAQMAKLSGARVVGIAGGAKKQKFLLENLKLDAAVDYKSSDKTIGEQLDEACPEGIDFFFDNVGGDVLDEVLQRINLHSRVVICGAVSQYDSGKINSKRSIKGPSHYIRLAETSSTLSGFNMMHFSKYFLKAIGYLMWHYYRGNITCPQHVENGIESFGKSLEKLFSGGHCGRLIVNVQK